MAKNTLKISDLIKLVESNKNIYFETSAERKRLKKMIEQYSYLNVFSLKYLFSNGIMKSPLQNGSFQYTYQYSYLTKYKILEKQYQNLLKMENKLREAVLMYETELKSHFTFFLEDFFGIENINFLHFLNALQIYNHSTRALESLNLQHLEEEWKKSLDKSTNYKNYYDYYYLVIKVLSFGTIGKILDAEYKGKKVFSLFSNYLKRSNTFHIGKQIKELKTIVILRNSLCHKESFIIFLEKGVKKNQILKTSTNFLQLRINAVSKIYEYYEKTKHNKTKKLKQNCWIKDYKKYRLNNGKNGIYFKKIKIYL